MNQVLNIILLAIAVVISLDALLLVFSLLFPSFLSAARTEAEDRHARSTWTGLLNVVFFSVIIAILLSLADNTGATLFIVMALTVGLIFLLGLVLGSAAIVMMVGDHLLPGREEWQRTMWGGVLVILACLTPYLGWFLLFPYLATRGFGAVVRTGWIEFRSRRARSKES